MATGIGFCLLYAGLLLGVLFNTEDGAGILLRKPHGVISQEKLISTDARISNPKIYISFLQYKLHASVTLTPYA
jgi:hypothetical protein